MIISLLLDMIYNVFSLLTIPISIPSLGDLYDNILNTSIEIFNSGLNLLNFFCDVTTCGILLGIIIAIDIGIGVYKFVMWILKKIPMLNVS